MRILYASMMLPFPPTFGKRMEIWTCLRALAAEGHEVTLLSFQDADQTDVDVSALSDVCQEVDVVPLQFAGGSSASAYLKRLAAILAADPYDAVRYRSREFARRVEYHLARRHFDAVICGEVFMLQNMPASSAVPLILKKDHIATTIFSRHARYERHLLKKAYSFLEYLKTSHWEKMVCRRATAIMACSELERLVLRKLCPGISVTVAPNVVDTDSYTPGEDEEPYTVLYSGLLDWSPNQDAVWFFIRSILPPLRQMVPQVKFLVAGRSSSGRFRRRVTGIPGVEFLGTVPDMRPVLRRAAVCVVPLRIGSGTRFKILEAGAMGKPVVSTRTGAEGLDFVDGTEILLDDKPELFARAVVGLLEDPSRRRAMGLAARRRVRASYSFPVLCSAIRETLALVTPVHAGSGMKSTQ